MYNEKKESSVNDLKKKERENKRGNVSLYFDYWNEKSGEIFVTASLESDK